MVQKRLHMERLIMCLFCVNSASKPTRNQNLFHLLYCLVVVNLHFVAQLRKDFHGVSCIYVRTIPLIHTLKTKQVLIMGKTSMWRNVTLRLFHEEKNTDLSLITIMNSAQLQGFSNCWLFQVFLLFYICPIPVSVAALVKACTITSTQSRTSKCLQINVVCRVQTLPSSLKPLWKR